MHAARSILAAVLLFAAVAVTADNPPSATPITKQTRIAIIRSLNAEPVFVRKPLPSGVPAVQIKNGVVTPGEREMEMLVAKFGTVAKVGDRARISSLEFKKDRIIVELNGGPVKKKSWYERIQIGGAGGMAPVAPDKDDPNATGTSIELVFDKFVPEMSGDQVRELLAPFLDFKAKSAAEAYLDTVPPKVRKAIKDKQVLVGMNREMVQYAKGRPNQRVRETEDGTTFEEWIYGTPPSEVQFVRFDGDEVVRLTVMQVNGEKVVRTEKEVEVDDTKVAQQVEPERKGPRKAPTLRKPGEAPDPNAPIANAPGSKPTTEPDR